MLFAVKLYQLEITMNEAKGIVKKVTTEPVLCFRSLFQGKKSRGSPMPAEEPRPPLEVPTVLGPLTPPEINLSPIQMSDIFKKVLQDERTRVKYGKYLDKQLFWALQPLSMRLETRKLHGAEAGPVPSSSY